MLDVLLLIAVFTAAYVGFALLALSQDRHWERIDGRRHCPARLVMGSRIAGYGLLAASLVIALVRDGASFGALLWATSISLAAVLLVATLSWRPAWLRPLSRMLAGWS